MANDNLVSSYQQLVSSYQVIDNFRDHLLVRLLLVAGAGGIFLLYVTKNGELSSETMAFLPFIGSFDFIVTAGLFVYKIYGIMKCTALIMTGNDMEARLGIEGQFLSRPNSFFNEPFAAGRIYTAFVAVWTCKQCRGRAASQSTIRMVGPSALYTGIVTTTQNQDGKPNRCCFWKTRMFLKEDGRWGCAGWQVTGLLKHDRFARVGEA